MVRGYPYHLQGMRNRCWPILRPIRFARCSRFRSRSMVTNTARREFYILDVSSKLLNPKPYHADALTCSWYKLKYIKTTKFAC